ncbi:hypothetical protein ABLM29_19160, partial [Nocardioides sp. YIM 152588]
MTDEQRDDPTPEPNSEPTPEPSQVRERDQETDRETDQASDQASDQAPDQAPDESGEAANEPEPGTAPTGAGLDETAPLSAVASQGWAPPAAESRPLGHADAPPPPPPAAEVRVGMSSTTASRGTSAAGMVARRWAVAAWRSKPGP